MPNAMESHLVFMPNVASIVHCKVGHDLDSNNIDTNAIFLGIPIGSITQVVGRAGVGKTHLAQQFTAQAAMEVVHIY
jgi:archaellum biogenesis ATPase FlaH